MDEALVHRLTLISAPAGAGKTIAVNAWAQAARHQGATFGWLSLDETDNTPKRCLDVLLCRALRETFGHGNWSLSHFESFLAAHEAFFPAVFLRPAFL